MANDSIDDIIEAFSLLDDWEERYRYVIELGRSLPAYPETLRDSAHKVSGCVSQVWLSLDSNGDHDPILTIRGDSDAHIVKGLVFILLRFYNGKRASEIVSANVEDLLDNLGLEQNLTPQRSNGLKSMIVRIRREAQQLIRIDLQSPSSTNS